MRKNIAIAVLALALLIPAASNAAGLYRGSSRGNVIAGEVYLGLKYGSLAIDDGVSISDDADVRNSGFMFGGSINDYLGLEFDYTVTVSTDDELVSGFIGRNIETDTLGFYLVGKTRGDFYIKGRVGYVTMDQHIGLTGPDNFNNTNYGIAASLGVGAKIGKTGAIEVEYTALPDTDKEDTPFLEDLESEFVTVAFVWIYE